MPMRLSVNVSLPLIERTLNQRYSGMLYEGQIRDWTGGDSEVQVHKKGPISLTGRRTYLRAEVPVAVKVALRQNDPGLINAIKSLAGIRRLDAELRAIFRIHLSFNPDWSCACTVDSDVEWIKKPTIGSLLPVKISSWMEPAIRRGLDQQAIEIRQGILSQLGLPDSLIAPWESIFSALSLNDSPAVFATGFRQKREAFTSPILMIQETLSIQTEVPVSARLSLGKAVSENPPRLPVHVPTDLSDEAGKLPVSWMFTPDQILDLLPSRRDETIVRLEPKTQSILLHRMGRTGASFRLFPSVSENSQYLLIKQVEMIHRRIPGFILSWIGNRLQKRLNRQLETSLSLAMTDLKTELTHLSLGTDWVLKVPEITWSLSEPIVDQNHFLVQGELYGEVGLHLDNL